VKTKITLNLVVAMFGFGMASTANCFAQTQIVTLATAELPPYTQETESYVLKTNQIVTILSLVASNSVLVPPVTLYHISGFQVTTTNTGTYTGLTNIIVSRAPGGNAGFVTLQIVTPATTTVISNYVPADAIVVPASVTGNV
jgi:hypothetical protein